MPASNSPPYAVLGIQQAVDVGSVFIQLKDGGMFYRLGGAEKNGSRFITEATNEHRRLFVLDEKLNRYNLRLHRQHGEK